MRYTSQGEGDKTLALEYGVSTDLLGFIGEFLSLVLIIASFLVMVFLAYRAKTFRSFQFQMFVVLLVLVIAEIPKILSDIGLLNVFGIQDAGLIIHTFSMILLSLFIAFRAVKYSRLGG